MLDAGGRVGDYCTDPKAYATLGRRQTIASNKDRKAEVKALRLRLKTKLDALMYFGVHEWLILSSQALSQPIETHRVLPKWRELAGEGIANGGSSGTNVASLERITIDGGTIALVKLTLGAILGGELDAYHEGLRRDASLTAWYLGEASDG